MIIDSAERFQGRSVGKGSVNAMIAGYGSRAMTAMEDSRQLIPVSDRKKLAENFRKIMGRFSLKPRHFRYLGEASSDSGLRRDLSRLSDPDSHSIPARAIKWTSYSRLLLDAVRRRGEKVDEDWLFHRLTLGTNFHPLGYLGGADPEKIVAGYEAVTMELDLKFSLMDTYHQISEILAEEGKLEWQVETIREYAETMASFSILEQPLCEYISEDLLEEWEFDGGNFLGLARFKQIALLNRIEEIENESVMTGEEGEEVFLPMNTFAIRSYLHAVDPNLALSQYTLPFGQIKPTISEADLHWLPHSLLGWGTLFQEVEIQGVENVRNSVDEDSVLIPLDSGWDNYLGYIYLILHPSMEMEQLSPLLMFRAGMDEGYSFDSLSLDTLTIPNGRFLPADLSRAEGSKWFSLEELLLDTRRIKDDLKSTADNIKRHPILIAENEAAEQRKKSIDLLFDDDFF